MKTAVIYARYSSDKQTEQSIEGQLRVCQEYALANKMLVVDTYIDRAVTGTNDQRAGFQKMMKDSNKKAWDYVLVYKLDRFSRDKYETAIHRRTLKNNGIKLISAMERIPDSPEGIILESLLEGMNQYYSAELSQKVKRGMRETRSKGMYTGGGLPYGYRAVDKKVVINDDEATIVRFIFSEYARGKLIVNIVKDLNEHGMHNKGKPFLKASVQRMLSNEKYIGIFRHEDEVFTNIYPPIVSKEVFEFVRSKLNSNRYGKHKEGIVYLLKDKLICGYCGSPVHSSSGTSKTGATFRYYRCIHRGNGETSRVCKLLPIRKEFIESVVVQVIKDTLSTDIIDSIVDKIMTIHKAKNESQAVLNILKQDLACVEHSIDNIVTAVANGISTKSTKARLEALEKQQEELQEKILCEESRGRTELTKKDVKQFFLKAITKEPAQIVNSLVDHVVLYDDKIEIFLNYQDYNKKEDIGKKNTIYSTSKTAILNKPKIGEEPNEREYKIRVKI